jgi:hypothetical protein
MMGVPAEARIVVKGHEHAEAVRRVLQATSSEDQPAPADVGHGWWHLAAEVLTPFPGDLEAALQAAPAALAVLGGAEDMAMVLLFEHGAAPVQLAFGYMFAEFAEFGGGEERAETSDALPSWSARNAPAPMTAESAPAFWQEVAGAKGSEFSYALLVEFGWRDLPPDRDVVLG